MQQDCRLRSLKNATEFGFSSLVSNENKSIQKEIHHFEITIQKFLHIFLNRIFLVWSRKLRIPLFVNKTDEFEGPHLPTKLLGCATPRNDHVTSSFSVSGKDNKTKRPKQHNFLWKLLLTKVNLVWTMFNVLLSPSKKNKTLRNRLKKKNLGKMK